MAAISYLSGEYLAKHPSWHVEDSAWKAARVCAMIQRNRLTLKSVVEIGCGAGEVLAQLQPMMEPTCEFSGFDISPDAFEMCGKRANPKLQFFHGDGLAVIDRPADLAIVLDVIEHVENYPEFLRAVARRARYCLFHIPLDLSLLSLITGLPQRVRSSAGHLHYFTRQLALQALRENCLQPLDAMYTRPAMERPNARLRGSLAKWPRLFLASCSEDLSALMLGGFSLLVLAKGQER